MAWFRRKKEEKEVADGSVHRERITLPHRDRVLITVFGIGALLVIALVLSVLNARAVTPLQGCGRILLSVQRDACYVQLANSTDNASVCSLVGTEQQRSACAVGVAMKENNVSACYEAGMTQADAASCAAETAQSSGSFSACLELNNDTYKSSCIYDLEQKYSFADVSYCNDIPNSTESSYCQNTYYYNKALNSLNATYCSMLPNTPSGTPLYVLMQVQAMNASSTGSLSYLEANPLATLNATDSAMCYYQLAARTGNPQLCVYTSGALNSLCLSESRAQISANYTNMTITPASVASSCRLAGLNGTLLDMCENYLFLSVATSRHNETYCSYITNASIEATCASAATNSST